MSDVAIAHKDYDVRGGGEILAEYLAETFDCPLFVGHGDPGNQPEGKDIDLRELNSDSRWHKLMAKGGALRGIAHMFHWRDNANDLDEFDTIITSGNEPLWHMPRDYQTVIAYTHTTPRWMYDLHHESKGFVSRTYQQLQRRLYEGPVKRPDHFVANSDLVARRINLYWNVPKEQISVVYPPIPTEEYGHESTLSEDYYLYLGRLAGPKCVDELINVFNDSDSTLVIAGDGPERNALREQANENIEFEGFVSETRKKELYAGAKALLYPPMNEDFGMVPIEAMASGTPVIGVNEGFTHYQIQEGENGLLFNRGSKNLHDALSHFESMGVDWSEREIAEWASQNFGLDRFKREMRQIVQMETQKTTVNPGFKAPKQGRSMENER